jgi:peptidoglycan/xylan/chitin deacetylase (PgdA/CDA1 family)
LGRLIDREEGAVILYGHRVSGDEEGFLEGLAPRYFAAQVEYLLRHHRFMALSTLVAHINEKKPIPMRSVVLTFDDGFRDNYFHAFPVLRRFGIPATVFVTTGCVSTGRLPWSQRLGFILQATEASAVQVDSSDAPLVLGRTAGRWRAYGVLKSRLRRMPAATREEMLDSLEHRLGVQTPLDRMLTWEQIKEMRGAGIEFGAHTVTHSLLGEIEPAEARWEMEKSLSDVQEHAGPESRAFAFPGGSTSASLVQLAKDVGFSSAFLPGQGFRVNNHRTASAFALARTGIINGPAAVLAAELDGPFPALRRLLRGASTSCPPVSNV